MTARPRTRRALLRGLARAGAALVLPGALRAQEFQQALEPWRPPGPLAPDEGFLVLDTRIDFPDVTLVLDEARRFARLPVGPHIELLRLPAGPHRWQEVRVPYFDLAHVLTVAEDDRWRFTIEAGRTNYAGTILVGEERTFRNVDVSMRNRSAQVRHELRAFWPGLLDEAPLRWAGTYPDPFLDQVPERGR